MKNGYACSIELNHRKVFSNLDYKKIPVKNTQCIAVNIRTEPGRLVPFVFGGKVVLALNFLKFSD